VRIVPLRASSAIAGMHIAESSLGCGAILSRPEGEDIMLEKTDAQIQRQVLDELKWDTRISETEVGVEVKNGVVTLVGTVDSWGKRLAAVEAAHRVVGVLDVANDLEVRVPGTGGRTDTEIAQAVRDALTWDVFVPDDKITSTVSHGIVSLGGTVDYYTQREDAERSVRNLSGVRSVNNQIIVRSSVGSGDVRKAVLAALQRHASHEANQIAIGVDDGAVTLSGKVDSWADRAAVIAAARSTRGVRSVDDHLRVGP
jgi:osmotically-inducible protein OsmY